MSTTHRRLGRNAILAAAVLVSGLVLIPSASASDTTPQDRTAGQAPATLRSAVMT